MRETRFNFNFVEGDLPQSHSRLNPTSTGNTHENPFDLTGGPQPLPKAELSEPIPPIPTFRRSLFQNLNGQGSSAPTENSSERPADPTERTQRKSTPYLAQPVPVAPGGLFQNPPSHGRSASTNNSNDNEIDQAQRHRRQSSFEPALPAILQPGGLFSGGTFTNRSTSTEKSLGEGLFSLSQRPRAASASQPTLPTVLQPGGLFSSSTASTENSQGEGMIPLARRPRAVSTHLQSEGLFSKEISSSSTTSDSSRGERLLSLGQKPRPASTSQPAPPNNPKPGAVFSGEIFAGCSASEDRSLGERLLFSPSQKSRAAPASQPALPTIVQPGGLLSGGVCPNSAASTDKTQGGGLFPSAQRVQPVSTCQSTNSEPRSIFQDLSLPKDSKNHSLFSKSLSQTLTPDNKASTYADLHTSTPSPESRRKVARFSPRHSRRSSSTVLTSTVTFGGSPGAKTPNTGSISSYSTNASIIDGIFRNVPSISAPSFNTPSVAPPSVNTPSVNLSTVSGHPNKATSTASTDSPVGTDGPTMAGSTSRKSNLETDTMRSFREEDSYSVRQESLPKAPIYDQSLQRGLAEVKDSLSNIASIMGESDLAHDSKSHFNTLYRETKDLSTFRYPETRIVGFIGDSGVGKSSLINSLLDEPNLARSGGGGSACTSMVTEFRSANDNDLHAYTIEVHFMASDDIRELLEELLRSFRVYYCESLNQEITSAEERAKCEVEADNAWTALDSIFHDQHELTQEFLLGEGSAAWEAIINKLQKWANTAVAGRSGDGQGLVSKVSTGSLQACKDYLDHLSAESHENGDPVLWPFIKLIRVYLKSPILRTGLVVTDLPGFRDSNYARVRATEKYLSHFCDEVFILTGIIRAESDTSIVDIKNRCPNKPKHIVCTRSEEVNPEEEARGKEDSAPHVRTMNERIRKSKDRLRCMKLNMRKGSAKERVECTFEYTELLTKIEDLEFERTKYLIDFRNRKVTAKLQEKYAGMGTFCVSNKLYSDHRDDEPRLAESYIALSGIRRLREHCQLVPAKAQLRAVSAYLRHQVPAHLGSLRQWILAGVDAVSSETAPVLREALEEAESVLRRDLLLRGGYVYKLRRDLIDVFTQGIVTYARDSQVPWTNQAVQVSQEWATWHHSTYAAYCRQSGTYSTKAQRDRSWNDELISRPRSQLIPQWNMIKDWLQSQSDNSEDTIEEIFQRLSNLLEYNEQYAPQSIGNLLISLESREQNIGHEIEGCLNQIIRSTEITSNDMVGGHASSFIGDLMRPAYVECNREGGNGSHARRKAIMHRHISDPRLFREYGNLARSIYTTAVKKGFAELNKTLKEQVDGIIRDLYAVIAEDGETTEAEQRPEISNQLESEVGNTQEVLERVQQILQRVEINSISS